MGAPDPRHTWAGEIDFRLQRQLASYEKQDPPPHRVKPLPIQVIRRIVGIALAFDSVSNQAIADMIQLAFFFLLRPGEYTSTPSDTTPFRFCDVRFRMGAVWLDPSTCPHTQLLEATFVTLTFTDQKNGVKGEVIGLSRTSDQVLCPVRAAARRVLHLRHFRAHPTAPLAQFFLNNRWNKISPADLSVVIKQAVTFLGPSLGFLASDVSARSLRASGAMALFNAKVDPLTIRLVGRWRSDEMLRYLHVQAEPVMRGLSNKMITFADYSLHPNEEVPSF